MIGAISYSQIDHIDFAGKVFVLTGFTSKQEERLAEAINARGGAVTKRVECADYLAVWEECLRPTEACRKAIALQQQAEPAIRIVSSTQLNYYARAVQPLTDEERMESLERAQNALMGRSDKLEADKKAKQLEKEKQAAQKQQEKEARRLEKEESRRQAEALKQKLAEEQENKEKENKRRTEERRANILKALPVPPLGQLRPEGILRVDTDTGVSVRDAVFTLHVIQNEAEHESVTAYVEENGGTILTKVTGDTDYFIIDAGYGRETEAYKKAIKLRDSTGWPRIITLDRFFRLSGLYRHRSTVPRYLDMRAKELRRKMLAYVAGKPDPEKTDIPLLLNSMSAEEMEDLAIEKGLFDPKLQCEWEKGSYFFASYKHDNKADVKDILRKLKSDGFLFWFDEGIIPGADWHDNIMTRLKGADLFIAMSTREYWSSDYCLEELMTAAELGKKIILLQLDAGSVPEQYEKYTAGAEVMDFRDKAGRNYEALYSKLTLREA